MGFILSLVDLAMQKLHLLLLLRNLIKSAALHSGYLSFHQFKQHCLFYHFLSLVEWIMRLLLMQ